MLPLISLAVWLCGAVSIIGADEPHASGNIQGSRTPVQKNPRVNAQLKTLLRWLPSDTESIIVAHDRGARRAIVKPSASSPIVETRIVGGRTVMVRSAPPSGHAMALERPAVAEVAMEWCTNLIFKILPEGDRHSVRAHDSETIQFAAWAGRGFRDDRRFANGPFFDGCQVIAFRPDSELEILDIVKTHASGSYGVGKHTVYKVKTVAAKRDDSDTLHFVSPGSSLLLVGTSRSFVEDSLRRVDGDDSPLAFPSELPEWRNVDSSSDIWGIRHYRAASATTRASMLRIDPAASGVVMQMNDDRVVVTHIGRGIRAETVERFWQEAVDENIASDRRFTCTRSAGDAIKVAFVSPKEDNPADMFSLQMTVLFGWDILGIIGVSL
jgi:hypothetical protein